MSGSRVLVTAQTHHSLGPCQEHLVIPGMGAVTGNTSVPC